MMKTEAVAQFEGMCVNYPMPDTRPKLYRIHGQVDMSQNKKPKTTYLSEIIDQSKKIPGRTLGPTNYNTEKSYDWAKLNTTKRY
jgi:hypothetical protein